MLIIDGCLCVELKHFAFCRFVVCKISFSIDTSGIQMALQVTFGTIGYMEKAGAKKKSQPKARNGGNLDHGCCRCSSSSQ
jgi:acetamidase/formamidase